MLDKYRPDQYIVAINPLKNYDGSKFFLVRKSYTQGDPKLEEGKFYLLEKIGSDKIDIRNFQVEDLPRRLKKFGRYGKRQELPEILERQTLAMNRIVGIPDYYEKIKDPTEAYMKLLFEYVPHDQISAEVAPNYFPERVDFKSYTQLNLFINSSEYVDVMKLSPGAIRELKKDKSVAEHLIAAEDLVERANKALKEELKLKIY